jgi:prepilin-type N-terminal cleavage/methylation domain-containing protein
MSRPTESSRPGCRPPVAAGFTLLEVLVALICFALVFGVLAQIMRTGLHQSASADGTVQASLLARSQLARVGVELPLQVGAFEGEVDDMRWRTAIRLAEQEGAETDIGAYLIDVTVAWGEPGTAGELTLSSYRIGPPPAGGLSP